MRDRPTARRRCSGRSRRRPGRTARRRPSSAALRRSCASRRAPAGTRSSRRRGTSAARPSRRRCGSKCARGSRPRASSAPRWIGSALGSSSAPPARRWAICAAALADLVAALVPGVGDGAEHLAPGGHAVARLGREVGAAVERDLLGRQERVERPAALAGHRLHGLHVDRVDVRALLAVDLHADEAARSSAARSPDPRRTRAPSRGTSGRPSSRSTRAAACPRRARAPSASSPHGSQSTGLSLCWRRYGDVSRARALAMCPRLPRAQRGERGEPQRPLAPRLHAGRARLQPHLWPPRRPVMRPSPWNVIRPCGAPVPDTVSVDVLASLSRYRPRHRDAGDIRRAAQHEAAARVARVATAQAADARARPRRVAGGDGVADEVAAHVVERRGDRVHGLHRAAAPVHARELRRRDRRGEEEVLGRRAGRGRLACEERARRRSRRSSRGRCRAPSGRCAGSRPRSRRGICAATACPSSSGVRRSAWPSRTSVGTAGSGPGARRRWRGDRPADAQRDRARRAARCCG